MFKNSVKIRRALNVTFGTSVPKLLAKHMPPRVILAPQAWDWHVERAPWLGVRVVVEGRDFYAVSDDSFAPVRLYTDMPRVLDGEVYGKLVFKYDEDSHVWYDEKWGDIHDEIEKVFLSR